MQEDSRRSASLMDRQLGSVSGDNRGQPSVRRQILHICTESAVVSTAMYHVRHSSTGRQSSRGLTAENR
jgi:hypothetical protein